MKDVEFKKTQWLQLFFAASIVLLAFLMKPGTSQDDRVVLFGFKTPVLCLHRLIYNQPCAGCGLTRSFVSFAHGDIDNSYKYHKLGIPLFIVVFLQIPLRLHLLRVGISGYTPFMEKLIWIPAAFCTIALIVNWLLNL
jgi:hypothetical protein